MILLKSADGETFEVEEEVAVMSVSIKHMIEDGCASASAAIPVPGITGGTLSKVLEYCRKYIELSSSEDESEIKKWEKEFINVDPDTLSKLVIAANFLDIKELLEVICEGIAAMIRGKSTEEMRKILNVKNDFTPGEEEAVKNENRWSFD